MFEDTIRYWAQFKPNAPAIQMPQSTITYRQFHDAILHITQALRPLGLPAGGRVLVSDGRPFVHWATLFALERLGCVSLSDDHAGKTLATLRPDAIIAESTAHAGVVDRFVQTSPGWLETVFKMPLDVEQERESSGDDPVRLVLSSGTTGRPKPILLTRRMVDVRISHAMLSHMPSGIRMMCGIGLDSAVGYQCGLATWTGGGTMIFEAGNRMAEAVDMLRPNNMMMAPIQLQRLLAALPIGFQPRPEMTIALAGSKSPRRLCLEASARLTPNLFFAYGTSEVGYVTSGSNALIDDQPGSTGFPFPQVEMQAVDDNDAVLPFGEVGRIRAKSMSMVQNYDSEDGALDASFKDGWFYPGDLGSIRADGMFILEGRDDDVINLGGGKISAWTIEEALLAETGVKEAAALALPDASGMDSLVAAVVADYAIDLNALAQAVGTKMRRSLRIIRVSDLPRNGMGKVNRAELRRALEAQLQGGSQPAPR